MTPEQRTKKAEQLRIAAQIVETGCEWDYKVPDGRIEFHPSEHETDSSRLGFCIQHGYEIRIKPSDQIKQLPVPEGYRELRDDEKDGRWIEGAKFLAAHGDWDQPTIRSGGAYSYPNYRIIVPLPKPQVPLEPGDVPPLSVLETREKDGWSLIVGVDKLGVVTLSEINQLEHYTYEELVTEGSRIKRPTDTEWQPCSKPAP